jgi:hypothetical protein
VVSKQNWYRHHSMYCYIGTKFDLYVLWPIVWANWILGTSKHDLMSRDQELMQSWIRTAPDWCHNFYFGMQIYIPKLELPPMIFFLALMSSSVSYIKGYIRCDLLVPSGRTCKLLTWNYICILKYCRYEFCGAFQVPNAEVDYNYSLFKQQSDSHFFS